MSKVALHEGELYLLGEGNRRIQIEHCSFALQWMVTMRHIGTQLVELYRPYCDQGHNPRLACKIKGRVKSIGLKEVCLSVVWL